MVDMPRPAHLPKPKYDHTKDNREVWERMKDEKYVAIRATGRPRLVNDPKIITEACDEYVAYCRRNPMIEQKLLPRPKSDAGYSLIDMQKIRIPTQVGLCMWLGISRETWGEWKASRTDLQDAIKAAEGALYEVCVQAAGSDLANAGIVTRLLGLTEKKEVSTTDNTPPAPTVDERMVANITHPDMTDEQAEQLFAAGVEPMLYSRAQIDGGMPWTMPDL